MKGTRNWVVLAVVALLGMSGEVFGVQPPAPMEGKLPKLSTGAMQLLVSGVALYPDPVVTLILDAAQHPTQLHQAAQANAEKRDDPARKRWPASIQTLAEKYPDVLAQLDSHAQMTTLLGLAYRAQPDDVWTAIEAVRERIEQQVAKSAPNGQQLPASVAYVEASTAVTGTLLLAPAAQELGAAVVVNPGPNGVAVAHAAKHTGVSNPVEAAAVKKHAEAKTPSPYAQPGKEQVEAANQALDKNWNMVNQARTPAPKNPAPRTGGKGPKR